MCARGQGEVERRMGLDGGTTATRSDILRGASWALNTAEASRSTRGGCIGSNFVHKGETVERAVARTSAWSSCALTGAELSAARGVCACRLGRLYDKQTIVEFILGKLGKFTTKESTFMVANVLGDEEKSKATRHLRSAKDFFDVHPTQSKDGDGFECPIRGVKATSGVDFVAMRPCGCVLSAAAVKAVAGGRDAATAKTCPACDAPSSSEHPLPINSEDPDVLRALRAACEQIHEVEALAEQEARKKRHKKHRRDRATDEPQPKRLSTTAAQSSSSRE